MNWFFIALVAPLLWSISNHIDKYLLSRFLKSGGAGALVLISSLIALLVIPVMYLINPDVVSISIQHILILILGGFISAIAILFYLYAMSEEETTIVVPLFQLIPLFLYIFGYIFLGETLTASQIFAGILIILGAIVLSLELEEEKKYQIKKRMIFLMISSSALYALYETLFKLVAIKEDFWVSNFWQQTGLLLFGILSFMFVSKYRKEFIFTLKNNGVKITILNAFNEIIYTSGNIIFIFATLLAPIALVGLVNAYQPIFVLIGGILITLFFPKVATEKIEGKHLAQKIIAILIIFIGSCLL